MGGRMMFPAFPHSRALPWILAVVSIASLVFGFIDENTGAVVLGVGGLAFLVLAYGLARLVIGTPEPDEAAPDGERDDHR